VNDTAPIVAARTTARTAAHPKLLFLVTEDWYFWSHRLPVARAARDAGFDVAVATRVGVHGKRIRAEGFRLCPLAWRRRGDGLIGAARAIAAIARLYCAERPDIVHHVALKPVLFGALAARLGFPRGKGAPTQLSAVMGLGGLTRHGMLARIERHLLGFVLRLAAAGGHVVVQNPEDGAALAGLGIDRMRVALIRGSGVDTAHFRSLPEPASATARIAFVGRMLRSKGVLDAVAAVRRLRERGVAVELLLAGSPDPDNRDSLSEAELRALDGEPGVEWLGRVEDVRTVWQRAAIAVLPTSYGEGVPLALLEAAACGRPIVAADTPGCREIVRHGETGLLVGQHDVAALADAIAALTADPARRQAMGEAGRSLVERDFAAPLIAEQTLALYRELLHERADRR
jgi:glycosyltransferase involved in cell wall biosynthesis